MELQSETLNELMPDFIKAVSELGNVTKDKQGYGYKYAELSTIIETSRPILAQNHLVITQLVTVVDNEPTLITTLFHKSGQFLRSCYPLVKAGVKQANDAQQVGAAITYARRYALTAMLFIAQEDDDAASVGKTTEQKNNVTPKPKSPTNSKPSTQTTNSTPPPQANKSTMEQLKDSLRECRNKQEIEERYNKQIAWVTQKHPELLDEYNAFYDECIFNLTT